MARPFYENRLFDKNAELPDGEGEFLRCHFEGVDFSRFHFDAPEFSYCLFSQCDLSMAVLDSAVVQETRFVGCKMTGIDFGKCSRFAFDLHAEDCLLDYAVFSGNNLSRSSLKGCRLREATFTECNLSGLCFEDCDLERAVFERCDLQRADFRSARHYAIRPELNRLRKAHFSYPGVLGLLTHLDIRLDP